MKDTLPISFQPEAPTEHPSRPFWSVMVPTYNPRRDFLEQTLNSVLDQDPGPQRMHIEVVDDASPDVNVEEMVQSLGRDRVGFFRSPKNLGLAGCWNQCIERSRGEWVHILHQDDFVLPEFYETLARAAAAHPDLGLLTTRSFKIDDENIIHGVSRRVRTLEDGGRTVDNNNFFPIHCPGVVVKRSTYEQVGGFRPDLPHVLDIEMWTRIIAQVGGLVTPQVLTCYRESEVNESSRQARSAESLRDIERLSRIFAERYPGFDRAGVLLFLRNTALQRSREYSEKGDLDAAKANLEFWNEHTTTIQRLRQFVGGRIRRVIG